MNVRQPAAPDARTWLVPAVIALTAATAALAVSWITGRFETLDRWEYSRISANIASGRGGYLDYLNTRYYFYGPPIYPLALAALLVTVGSEAPMIVLQAGMLAVTAVIVYRIGNGIWGSRVGTLAGLAVALHPGSLIYAGRLHSQLLDVLIITFTFAMWLRMDRDASAVRSLGTGWLVGLSILSRGTMGPSGVAWFARFLWRGRRELARTGAILALASIGVALALAPVLARGYATYGRFVPMRTDAAVNLWYGNHDGASGTSYTLEAKPRPVVAHIPKDDWARLGQMDELEQYDFFNAKVAEWVRDHTATAATLFVKKLWYYWWESPHTGLLYPRTWTAVYGAYYALALAFALAGIAATYAAGPAAARNAASVFLLMALFASLTQAAFYVEGRHRWQMEPVLLLFSAVGAVHLFDTLRRRGAGGDAHALS